MRIAVVGAGAMGSLFGGMLASGGHEVWLIDVWREHVEALNKHGIAISGPTGDRTIPVKATTDPAEVGPVDLVLIFVKSYDTRRAMLNARPLIDAETMVLTLQNGLGNVEEISAAIGQEKVLAGTTAHGATMLGPGRVRHAGVGETVIGAAGEGESFQLKSIVTVFQSAGIQTHATDDVHSLLWGKLLINTGINALTALTHLKNGQLLEHPEIRALMRDAVLEGAEVARVKGIKLLYPDPVEKVETVARATAENKSSMLQDVERGRRTEINAINGVIYLEGEHLGVPVPVNRVLTLLILGLKEGGQTR